MRQEPGHRLITQNLLASAAVYEREKQINWSTVRHLSLLIDLMCLYNEIRLIGRDSHHVYKPDRSELFSTLSELVRIGEFNPDDIEIAAARMAVYYSDSAGPDRYRALIYATSTSDGECVVQQSPDEKRDLHRADEWVKGLPKDADPNSALQRDGWIHREVSFLVRTFLYFAHASSAKIAFTPDEVREEALEPMITADRNLRQRILTSMREAADKAVLVGDVDIVRNTTPLAAIVFSRASDRKDIARQITILREELSALRARLGEAEDSLYWATHDEEAIASAKWNAVFGELERRYGEGTGVVNYRSLLTFSLENIESIIDPTKLVKLIGLPISALRRYLTRRPIFEIHRLAQQLPGNQRLCREVERLFGRVYP
jgi:hypothetical protein